MERTIRVTGKGKISMQIAKCILLLLIFLLPFYSCMC